MLFKKWLKDIIYPMNHKGSKNKIKPKHIIVPQVNALSDSFLNVYHLFDKA